MIAASPVSTESGLLTTVVSCVFGSNSYIVFIWDTVTN
jgi:hypothetical protein